MNRSAALLRLLSASILLPAFLAGCNLGMSTPPAAPAVPYSQPIDPTGIAGGDHPGTVPPRPPADTPRPADTVAAQTDTPASMRLKIFLIALEDGGGSGTPVGCGDSVVPVDVEVPYTTGVLRAALEKLLSIRAQYYGESGLYNALHQSSLTVRDASIEGGRAVVHLEGALSLGGACDDPRAAAQLRMTALQFPSVTAVSFFVNGTPLAQLLSGQG